MDDCREVVCHDLRDEWRKGQLRRERIETENAWREEVRRRKAERQSAMYGDDSRL